VEQLAQQFLEIAEFRTLQLGNWLGTTDGAIIAAAVEMVMPPFFQEDVELLVAALKLAADMQHVVGRETAARLAFGFAGVVVLVALVSTSGRPNTG
jgi:hypothetical protein